MICLYFIYFFEHFMSDMSPRTMLKQPPIGFISLVHNRLALIEETAIAFRLSPPHKAPLSPH